MAPQRDWIQTVNGDNFGPLVLQGAGPIVVEFMSYGCAYCRNLEPVLQQVAEQVSEQETIFRVNTAVAQELANSYQIEGTPTLLMFLNGSEVGRVTGPTPDVSSLMATIVEPFQS